MISFVIPAYNEEKYLTATLRAIFRSMEEVDGSFEMIVVDDASTDRTAEIARELGARLVSVNNRHIAPTRNAGAQAARGDLLFFVDADTQVNPVVIRAALRTLHNGAIGGGALIRFEDTLPLWARVVFPLVILGFRMSGYTGGGFLFCTKSAFDRAGGFPEELYAAEDLGLIRALKRFGRFTVVRPLVVTSARKVGLLGVWGFIKIMTHSLREREGLELWYGDHTGAPR